MCIRDSPETELGLQLQAGDAVGVAGDDVDGGEPDLQGQVAAVHDRARGDGSLFAAGGALPGEALTLQRPALRAAAGGADEPLRPAPPRQVVRAGRVIREARLELGARAVSYTHLRAHETVLDLVCR